MKIQIINGVYPAFADCPVNAKPNHNLMHFINARWGLALKQFDEPNGEGQLPESVIYAFEAEKPAAPSAAASLPATSTWW